MLRREVTTALQRRMGAGTMRHWPTSVGSLRAGTFHGFTIVRENSPTLPMGQTFLTNVSPVFAGTWRQYASMASGESKEEEQPSPTPSDTAILLLPPTASIDEDDHNKNDDTDEQEDQNDSNNNLLQRHLASTVQEILDHLKDVGNNDDLLQRYERIFKKHQWWLKITASNRHRDNASSAIRKKTVNEDDEVFGNTEHHEALLPNDNMMIPSALAQSDDAFVSAICLLRTMRKRDWVAFDRPFQAEEEEEDEQAEDEQTEEENGAGNDTPTRAVDAVDDNTPSTTDAMVGATSNGNPTSFVEANDLSPGLKHVQQMLAQARSGTQVLTTERYNYILLCLVLSSELSIDEIRIAAMKFHSQMKQLTNFGVNDCAPNDLTCEILLTFLFERCAAHRDATDLVKEMTTFPSSAWNRFSMVQALNVCHQRNELSLASQVLKQVEYDEGRSFRIPYDVYRTVIKMARAMNDADIAIDCLASCLREHNQRRDDKEMNSIFMAAGRWPVMNNNVPIDNSVFLNRLVLLLSDRLDYSPNFRVWRQIMAACAFGSKSNPSRAELFQRCYLRLSSDIPDFWPNRKLLEYGLDASESLSDSDLAADLTSRLATYAPERSRSSGSVSVQSLRRALLLCFRCRDLESTRTVLESIENLGNSIPQQAHLMLFELAVSGYASAGQPERAEALLLALSRRKLTPSEQAYGAAIQGFANAGKYQEALRVFETVKSGEHGTLPSTYCYGGMILANVKQKAWSEAIETYSAMRDKGIAPDETANHGVLLSLHRLGGVQRALQFLEVLSKKQGSLSMEGYLHALKMLVPEVGEAEEVSVGSVRRILRGLQAGDTDTDSSIPNLIAALKVFEVEGDRTVSRNTGTESVVSRRRAEASRHVLQCLVACVRELQSRENTADG